MTVTFAARTDVGRVRSQNEDNFLVDRKLRVFVVCDGMGGHLSGEVASATAVNVVHERLKRHQDVLDGFKFGDPRHTSADVLAVLEDAVHQADRRIYERSLTNAGNRGMGTTLSLLLVIGGTAFTAHVGDSRIYRFRDDKLEQVTDDHTLANAAARDATLAATGMHEKMQHAITRAVGVNDGVEVDTACFEITPGDRFLLSSDGLHGLVGDAEIGLIAGGEDLDACVDQLINAANGAGGNDNITALLVQVGGVGEGPFVTREKAGFPALRGAPLFASLEDAELRRLTDGARVGTVAAGVDAIAQGRSLFGAYVVAAGRAVIRRNGQIVGVLEPGSHFGEQTLFGAMLSPASIGASDDGDLTLLVLDAPTLDAMKRSAPALALKLMTAVAASLAVRVAALGHISDAVEVLFAQPNAASPPATPGKPQRLSTERRPAANPRPRAAGDGRVMAPTLPAEAGIAAAPPLPARHLGAAKVEDTREFAPPPLPAGPVGDVTPNPHKDRP